MRPQVLIVDDDSQTLMLFREVLRPVDVDILEAQDGAQALRILEAQTPVLMFLDVFMPKVTGREVLNYISKTPHLDPMVVVVVSAHRALEPVEWASRAHRYLVKPISPRDLRTVAQQALALQATQ